jgi:hypothetical protein
VEPVSPGESAKSLLIRRPENSSAVSFLSLRNFFMKVLEPDHAQYFLNPPLLKKSGEEKGL